MNKSLLLNVTTGPQLAVAGSPVANRPAGLLPSGFADTLAQQQALSGAAGYPAQHLTPDPGLPVLPVLDAGVGAPLPLTPPEQPAAGIETPAQDAQGSEAALALAALGLWPAPALSDPAGPAPDGAAATPGAARIALPVPAAPAAALAEGLPTPRHADASTGTAAAPAGLPANPVVPAAWPVSTAASAASAAAATPVTSAPAPPRKAGPAPLPASPTPPVEPGFTLAGLAGQVPVDGGRAGLGQGPDTGTTGPAVTLKGEPGQWQQPLLLALGDRLQLQIAARSEQAVIKLDPPLLGQVEIAIRQQGGELQVRMSASHGEVTRQLQQVSETLRQDLVQRHSGEVTVQVTTSPRGGDDARQARDAQSQQQQQQAQDQREQRRPGHSLREDEVSAVGFAALTGSTDITA